MKNSSLKILVVEDEEDSRVLLCAILEGKGYSVMSASNGKRALEIARDSAPEIIITDILMPEMDGYSLCREIKSDPKLAHIAVVFYSATYTNNEDKKLGLALGASQFILKPQEPEVFISLLTDVIHEYQAKDLPVPQKAKELSKSLAHLHEEVLINKLQSKVADLKIEKNELFISREKYRSLVESLERNFIFLSYDNQEKLTYISPSVHSILGYSQEEFLTLHANLLTKNFSKQDARLRHSFENVKNNYFEVDIVDKNGVLHCMEIKETPIFDNEKKLISIDGIAQDATEKRAQQKLLEEAKKQLVTSEKLASIGRLAAGVCHEILNPLNIISVQTQVFKRSRQDDIKIQEFCSKLRNEVDRITKVTGVLLKFSHKGKTRKSKITIKEIIEDSIESVKHDFSQYNISINTIYDETLCEIFADKDQMREVFINIFSNAKYAMPDGGVLSITCQRKNKMADEFVHITISDTGIGIKEENLDKVFDPFFTTKPEGDGKGMGLATIHGIIHEHSGTITVASIKGKGTTFTIDLPSNYLAKEHTRFQVEK